MKACVVSVLVVAAGAQIFTPQTASNTAPSTSAGPRYAPRTTYQPYASPYARSAPAAYSYGAPSAYAQSPYYGRVAQPYASTMPYVPGTFPYIPTAPATNPYMAATNPYMTPYGGGMATTPYGALMNPRDGFVGTSRPNGYNYATDTKAHELEKSMTMLNILQSGTTGVNSIMSMAMSQQNLRTSKYKCDNSNNNNPMKKFMMAKIMGQSGTNHLLDMMECNGAFAGNPMMKYLLERKLQPTFSGLVDVITDGIDCDQAWATMNLPMTLPNINIIFNEFQFATSPDMSYMRAVLQQCDAGNYDEQEVEDMIADFQGFSGLIGGGFI